MNLIKLSWKNLTYKPLNMLLTTILFALGVGLIALLFILEKQLKDNFEKNLAGIDLIIGAKGSPLQLFLCSMYHIDAPTGNISLKEAKPFLNPAHPLIEKAIPLSLGDSYKGYRIVGTEQAILDIYGATIGSGNIWEKNFEVTIGASAATDLNLKIGDQFKSSHGFTMDENLEHDDATSFRIVGVLKPTGTVIDQLILTTPQSFWLTHEHHEEEEEGEEGEEGEGEHHHAEEHENHEDEISVVPKSLLEEDEEKEITAILLKFKNRSFQALNMLRGINENTDMQAASPAIEMSRLFSLMDSGEQALRILALVIMIVSALSIFISLYASLRERQYELALMRVMGSGKSKLFLLIVLEGVLLAVLGFLAGIILSHTGMYLLAGVMKNNYRYTFSGFEFLPQEGWIFVASLFIGFLAAIIPALKASGTDISETLSK